MAERFRDMLAAPGAIELPGCYDTLSAMLLEAAGFSAVFLSGYGFAASALGNPDIGLTTLTETMVAARHISNAVGVPLVVDTDDGYGNEDNVLRTVRELEGVGAAAMIMEDQISPKRCGHTDKKRVLSLAEYMKKLEHALAGRNTPLCIVARTDSMDLTDAIERAKAFHAAGADVTLIDGLRSLDDAKRVADEVPGLKQINLIHGGKTPLLSAAEWHAMGFKVVLYSTPALYLAFATLAKELKVLKETGDLRSISENSVPFRAFQDFVETRYLGKLNQMNEKGAK